MENFVPFRGPWRTFVWVPWIQGLAGGCEVVGASGVGGDSGVGGVAGTAGAAAPAGGGAVNSSPRAPAA